MSNLHTTFSKSYNEAEALQQLLRIATETLSDLSDNIDKMCDNGETIESTDLDVVDEFYITVGGVQIAFYMGPAQCEALYAFIKHLAGENLYEVNFDDCTVKGW